MNKELEEFEKICGRPKHFDFDKFIEVVKSLTYSDEPMNALKMLDLCPSFYREHEKDYLRTLRENILSRIASPVTYVDHYLEFHDLALQYEKDMSIARHKENGEVSKFEDMGDMIHEAFCYPRGPVIIDIVRKLNEQSITPHIIEFGPATYWLPHGLKKQSLNFKYKPLSLSKMAMASHGKHLKEHIEFDLKASQYHIFVCFEVIEHLWNDADILVDYFKQDCDFKIVALSTPLHTFDGGDNSDTRELQHLRCYSKQEFIDYANKNFPNRTWNHYLGQSQVLIGTK